MEKEILLDVIAERYTSSKMTAIWSPRNKIRYERELWVAVLRAQAELGLPVSPEELRAYEKAIYIIDLDLIRRREEKTRHDVKARIESFNCIASGYAGKKLELIHQGLTSRDLTENVEQLQILHSLKLVREKTVSILSRLVNLAVAYKDLNICGRSHFVPAQTTTLGKRFSNLTEEMLVSFDRLDYLISHYPLRGIKGPVGTQQDMVDLLGSPEKAITLERKVMEYLEFECLFDSVGQIYPRSLDSEVVGALYRLASAPVNFAMMIRLMAGLELAHEGFGEEQTGSSAMPHKVNSRTCERAYGLLAVMAGFQTMTNSLVGNQWFEGDVSCSVVRRVALPGSFFAIDGIFESTLTVLDEMEIFPAMIEKELRRYLPFLSTTKILMATLKKGIGRETAHKIIKRHAQETVKEIRSGGDNTFMDRLSSDKSLRLSKKELENIMARPDHGLAEEQIEKVCKKFKKIAARFPDALSYKPEPIL